MITKPVSPWVKTSNYPLTLPPLPLAGGAQPNIDNMKIELPSREQADEIIQGYINGIRKHGGYEASEHHDPVDRDDAITLYKALIAHSGWEFGRNNVQACLPDCSFIEFRFSPIDKYETCITTIDFTPEF